MALLEMHYFSTTLRECSSMDVVVPESGLACAGKMPVLWLLPPVGMDHTAWRRHAVVEELAERFRSGPLAQAAALGAARTQPESGPLTEFERLCDDAVTGYLASASRVPFGEETVIGYLYAREAEITAVRIIMAGRMAGLDGETIRSRLRATYV